jgi:hypothetical protein
MNVVATSKSIQTSPSGFHEQGACSWSRYLDGERPPYVSPSSPQSPRDRAHRSSPRSAISLHLEDIRAILCLVGTCLGRNLGKQDSRQPDLLDRYSHRIWYEAALTGTRSEKLLVCIEFAAKSVQITAFLGIS